MPDSELTIQIDQSQAGAGVVTARLAGDVDPSTVASLLGELQVVLLDGALRELVIDLGGVEFMDSSGIRVLIDVHNQMRERDGVLVLEQVPPTVRSVLEITGLADHLELR
jgi:anti-anti-sigma factor